MTEGQAQVPQVMDRELEVRAAVSAVIARAQFLKQAGITFNGKRDLYEIFGYDRVLTPKDYRDRYARGGIAKRIVEAYPNATWRGGVELIEDEDPKKHPPFEQDWISLDSRLKVQSVLRKADILSGLSTYSVILIGTADGQLDQPLPRGNGPDGILFLSPFMGGGGPTVNPSLTGLRGSASYAEATVKDYEEDVRSPRFAMPKTYQLSRDTVSKALQIPVHWSRIIHLAENTLDNEVFGTPTLEACWNLLDDLDKVTGGGAEAYFLRVNRGLHLDMDRDMELKKEAKEDLAANVEKYEHGILRILKTRGIKVTDLGSDVANITGPVDAILTQIAGTKGIPKRILTGSEMGEMASSQDRDNWKDQVDGRQTQYAGPSVLQQLVDRLIEYKYLSAPGAKGYEVRWPHIQTLTEAERAEGAKAWATVNKENGSTVFLDSEIRDKWYGMAALTPDQLKMQMELQQAAMPPAPTPPAPTPDPNAVPADAPALKAAEEHLLEELVVAVRENDLEVIDRILGLDHEAVRVLTDEDPAGEHELVH